MTPAGRITMKRFLPMLTGLIFMGTAISACSVPLPARISPDSAAIGVTVTERWAGPGFGDEFPQMIYFVRLEGEGDVAAGKEILRSNYHRNGRAYLLNAKPGRYAMVASSEFVRWSQKGDPVAGRLLPGPFSQRRPFRVFGGVIPQTGRALPRLGDVGGMQLLSGAGGVSAPSIRTDGFSLAQMTLPLFESGGNNNDYFVYTTYFSEELIRKTMVDVRPGRMAVMGDFLVERRNRIEGGDKAQRFYHRTIDTLLYHPNGHTIINDDPDASIPSRGGLLTGRAGREAEIEFLLAAAKDFRGTGWSAILQRSLAELRKN